MSEKKFFSSIMLAGMLYMKYGCYIAMRLNSRTGIDGLPVSSIYCDRPLHSGIALRVPEL